VNDVSRRPAWDLTCYGLNLSWHNGRNILQGDISPEELRLEAYAQHMLAGNIGAYVENVGRVRVERGILVKRVLDDPGSAANLARMPAIPDPGVAASASAPVVGLPPVVQVPQVSVPLVPQVAVPPDLHQTPPPNPHGRPAFAFGQIPEMP